MGAVFMIGVKCLLVAASLWGGGGGMAETATAETGAEPRMDERAERVTIEVSLEYLLWLPDGYDEDASAEWPLVLFLHGAGERGDDLDRVRAWGPPKFATEGESLPYILVAPQCPADSWWNSGDLLRLLDRIQQDERVDADRVYVTGLSMGGYGTWDLAAAAPDRFAAIAPVCGGAGTPLFMLERLTDLPIWAFHGSDDDIVPLSESVQAVERVRAGGGEARLTVYEGVGHDSWRRAYADEAFWAWLLSQKRE